MSPRDIIKHAIDELESRGWCRGSSGGPFGRGPCCLVHALQRGEALSPIESFPELENAYKLVDESLPYHSGHDSPRDRIMVWNDKYCHSREEAIAVLERAKAAA